MECLRPCLPALWANRGFVAVAWYDDEIAGPMGYEYCVLFDCARDALKAWRYGVVLPGNICREVYRARPDALLEEVDQTTGLARYCTVHLYGYQSPAEGITLGLDPLMTGWVRQLKTESAIVSFGRKKMLSIGYGGAFLTNNEAIYDEMKEKGRWNSYYTAHLLNAIIGFHDHIQQRWEVAHWWDRYLDDSLIRIPGEQLMPWRAMRRASDWGERQNVVNHLRDAGIDVGTNYPPLEGNNEWGDTVLNFFCTPGTHKGDVQRATDIIKQVVHG